MKKKPESKKEMYEREILEVIKKFHLFCITDIFAYYSGCSRETLYHHKLHESDTIKRAVEDNKTKACQSLVLKWYNSDNPTLQLAAYKVLCKDDDRMKLSMNYNETNIKGGLNITWAEEKTYSKE